MRDDLRAFCKTCMQVVLAFAKVRKQRKEKRHARCGRKGRKQGTKGKGCMKPLLSVAVEPSTSWPFRRSGVALLRFFVLFSAGGGTGDAAATDARVVRFGEA